MSAQPKQYVTTRLLIAEKSENAAYELDSTLRDAGVATKLSISDDLAHIAKLISDGETDIVILTDKMEGLEKLLPRIHENAPNVPLILLVDDSNEQSQWTVAQALALGAADLVPSSQKEQLALVVQRELERICERTQTSQLRRALKEAEQRCQLLLQGSSVAIAYVHEGMHIHANEGYLQRFGYNDLDELGSASLMDLLDPASGATLKAQLKKLRSGATEASFEFTSHESCGEPFTGTLSLTNSRYEGEECLQVTVKAAIQEKTAESSDAGDSGEAGESKNSTPIAEVELGLPGFLRSADTQFSSHNGDAYILCMGLDSYSETQAAYGLLGAEYITRRVWLKLEEIASDYTLTRFNPHQFAIAVPAQSADQVREFCELVRQKISEEILEVQDKTVRPTVTIAGCVVTEKEGIGACLDNAFNKLLDAMEQSSNTVAVATPDLQEDMESGDVRLILKQINDAIEKKMFVLLYQPIISLRGDNDEHYEVFLRMVNDAGDQIEPGVFLQTAIDNNVAGKIDRWVILQSIKMLSGHRARGNATRLTINLSANSVVDPEFPQWLAVAIKAARLPSDAVIFQITERDATTYLRQTREFAEKLRSMHCRASLSRFGLIEDPFETLRHISVDMVKLDGKTISEIESDSGARERTISTISKLQAQGKLTIVPMVENANILSTLWQAGANYIQGHYLQEPTADMDYDFNTEE